MREILKYIPIITALLIFLSFIKMHAYYKVVGLDIYNFVDAPELLLSFIPFLLSSSLIFILPLGVYLFLYLSAKSSQKHDNRNKETPWIKYATNPFIALIVIVSVVFVMVQFGFAHYVIGVTYSLKLWVAIIAYCISLALIVMLLITLHSSRSRKSETEESYDKMFDWYIGFIVCIFSVVFFIFYGYEEGESKVAHAGYEEISFDYNGVKIKADSNLVFYGQTKTYIFMYSRLDGCSKIYDRERAMNIKYLSEVGKMQTKYGHIE